MSEDVAYCVCRSSDDSGFMIGCDNCDEWYHLKCISMTKKRAFTFLKFYCSKCRDRDPSLKNELVKESKKYVVYTISSSEVTNKQGTVRKRSPSPQRSNKVARYEDDATPEKRNYEDKDDDHQDETSIDNSDSCEKNNEKSGLESRSSRREANTTPADKERTNEKHIKKERKKSPKLMMVWVNFFNGCLNMNFYRGVGLYFKYGRS